MCKKLKASSFTCQLESIILYCYGHLNCAGEVHYFRSSILSEFSDRGSTGFKVCYQWLINLVLPIDSDRLQMRSLGESNASFGFLRLLRHHFRASYDSNSWLHVLSRQRLPVPFLFLCMGNDHFTSVSTGRNGTKTSPFISYCTYMYIYNWGTWDAWSNVPQLKSRNEMYIYLCWPMIPSHHWQGLFICT